MATPINPNDGLRANRPLPPELAFLKTVPNLKEMDPNDALDWMWHQHELIRQHAALIREHGMDPDKLIAFTEPSFRAFEKAQKAVEDAEQKQFHSLADLADSQYNLFKAMEAVVNPAYEKAPFDPEVQEMKEYLEEWRKHMPKE
jgi:hypothetical protein